LLWWAGGILLTGVALYYLFRKPKKEKR
jgi:hypothetical protein